jgi:hypothetical protein
MRLATALLLVLFAGGVGPSTAFPQCFHVGAVKAQENPRPWMQGTQEIGCSRDGVKPRDQAEHVEWHACACHHTKKAGGSCDDETQGRQWDPSCSTRCSPRRCLCERNRDCETE